MIIPDMDGLSRATADLRSARIQQSESVGLAKPYNPIERIAELEQALKNAALTFYELGFLMARQRRVKTAKYCNDAGRGCCDVLYKGIS